MGTNFYILNGTNEGPHIGKRSAAGLWCWECNVTLLAEGIQEIHSGKGYWLECCPNCGATKSEESLDFSSAGRELGFNKSDPMKKTGVASCASFSWAIEPSALEIVERIVN